MLLWLCLVGCKIFSECKIFSSENIFGKGKYFQVFGCIPKNTLENIFQCLVVLLKMLQNSHFYHVSHIFLGSKQILLQRIKIYKQETKIKTKKIKITGPIVARSVRGFVSEDEGWVDRFMGSWRNLTVVWRGRGRRSDQRDLELSLFARLLGLSLSLSLFARLRK